MFGPPTPRQSSSWCCFRQFLGFWCCSRKGGGGCVDVCVSVPNFLVFFKLPAPPVHEISRYETFFLPFRRGGALLQPPVPDPETVHKTFAAGVLYQWIFQYTKSAEGNAADVDPGPILIVWLFTE